MLASNETVIAQGRPHWQMLAASAFIAALGILGVPVLCAAAHAAHGPAARFEWIVAVGLLLVTLLPFLYEWAYRRSIEYVVTDQRLIVSKGLFGQITRAVLLSRVSGVEVDQSLVGRIVGFGTILVLGFSGAPEVLYGIPDPYGFQRIVQEQLHLRRGSL